MFTPMPLLFMERKNARSWKTLLVVQLSLVCLGVICNIRYIIVQHYHQQKHSTSSNAYDRIDFDAPLFPPSARKVEFWEKSIRKEASHCHHVDNICSSSQHGGWFYDVSAMKYNGYSTFSPPLHQPTLSLYLNESEIELMIGLEVKLDRRIHFSVSSPESSTFTDKLHDDELPCSYSPISHHMVLHSDYNHMIGEFYSRTILGLYQVLKNIPQSSVIPNVQYYIHFVDRRNDMFDGHRLFLGGLPNHTDRLENFVSLMPQNTTCRCYQKLIFCGYDANNEKRKLISSSYQPQNSSRTARVNDDLNNENAPITLKPGEMIGNTNCKVPTCTVYRKLRRGLIENYYLKYPDLEELIQQYRRKILINRGLLINNDTSSINQWKFVGLTHRTLRRKWLNIQDALSMCQRKFTKQYNVVCLTVNVEEATSPMEQLLMHRSLHALIGVHGAQLTQGVLLPNHAYIVELLPWIPEFLWGGWVATVNVPTPLGIIFLQTELNHLGYSLGRESVPFCLDVYKSEDDDADKACLLNETSGVRKKIRWDKRNFTVPLNAIADFISRFLLQDSHATCEDVEERGNETRFVLYNVYCKQRSNHMIARQYYRG
jgi:hypothetical protein